MIELKIGGPFEIYFLTENSYGSKGSEGCKILSYLPYQMLSFSWNAPPQFETIRNHEYKTWVVLQFKKINEQKTQLELSHLGWPDDEKWLAVFNYFDKAWESVFQSLEQSIPSENNTTTPSNTFVKGIGGVFFHAKNPSELKHWYKDILGFNIDDYGTNFEWLQAADTTKKGFTQWSPFKEDSTYFAPSTKSFMLNYLVSDLETLVNNLKKKGVTFLDEIETFEYGKFIHLVDIENNKIELWEPFQDDYEKILEGVTK